MAQSTTGRFFGIRAHVEGEYRSETLLGKDYIVVPVVALVEGVLQGMTAEGPELALADEFGRFVDSWNNRPLTESHPVNKKGVPISANTPQALVDWSIGTIYNARIQDKKLVLEAWVEVERAKNLNANSKSTLKALQSGEMIEVSTGYFSQLEETSGEYDGKEYIAIQRNIVPDHLAFLPNGVLGACSNEDGCGAPRANSVEFRVNLNAHCDCGGTCGDCGMPAPVVLTTETSVTEQIENAAKKRKKTDPKAYQSFGEFATNAARADLFVHSFPESMLDSDAEKLVQQALRSTQAYTYLIGLTASMAIYEQYDQFSGYYKTYQRTYEVSSDGKVTLGNDVQEVNLVTQILPIVQETSLNANGNTPTDKETTMSEIKPGPAANADPNANPESKLTTLQSVDANGHKVTIVVNEKNEVVETKVEVKAQEVVETPKASTLEQLLANANPELKETLETSVKLHQARKTEIIANLKKTDRCKFTDQQLAGMGLEQLENLATLANVPSFEGRALPISNNEQQTDDDAAPPAPMCFEIGKPTDPQVKH